MTDNAITERKKRTNRHTQKAKDWVSRTSLNNDGELRCSGKVCSSWFTSGTVTVQPVNHFVSNIFW
jgi:hypothetical protein